MQGRNRGNIIKDKKQTWRNNQSTTKVVSLEREQQEEDFLYSEFFNSLRNERDIQETVADCHFEILLLQRKQQKQINGIIQRVLNNIQWRQKTKNKIWVHNNMLRDLGNKYTCRAMKNNTTMIWVEIKTIGRFKNNNNIDNDLWNNNTQQQQLRGSKRIEKDKE